MQVHITILIAAMVIVAAAVAGGTKVLHQHQALWDYQQTQAEVIEQAAEPVWLGRDKYKPAIRYRYRTGGQHLESDRLTPLPYHGDEQWARRTLDQFGLHTTVPAYVNPDDPAQIYVVRRAAFWPYLLLMAPAVALLIVLRPLYAGGVFENPPFCAKCSETDWYHVWANRPAGGKAFNAGVAMLAWYGYGAALFVHYAMVGSTTPDWLRLLPVAVTMGYAAVGGVPAYHFVRAWNHSGRFAVPEVLITRAEPEVDKPIIARVHVPVLRETHVCEVTVALSCHRRHGVYSQELYSQTYSLARNVTLSQAHGVTKEVTFEVPPKKRRGSSAYNRWSYPRVDWRMTVAIKTQAGAVYRTEFPIHMRPPSAQARGEKPRLRLAG